jgi:RIO kinase 2
MKLDPDLIQYMTKDHFRVLTAVEMGMKNHEFVPLPLIESLAALKRSNTYKVVQHLLKHKLVFHTGKNYSGYALTYMGYDYLALRVFMKRGHVKKVLCQIGVGKESDIYICDSGDAVDEDGKSIHNGNPVVIKFARLGRTSFRTIKDNRDYLKGRSASSWLYMSRIASLKEYAFMSALYKRDFPTPTPYDANRHGIVMSLVKAYPMVNVKGLSDPAKTYRELMDLIMELAEHGLVHGDFNEFNLMISEEEKITVIDFPQMTSTTHLNAQFYFERDVRCVQSYFTKRFGLQFEGVPILETDVVRTCDLDKEIKASGCFENELNKEELAMFDQV